MVRCVALGLKRGLDRHSKALSFWVSKRSSTEMEDGGKSEFRVFRIGNCARASLEERCLFGIATKKAGLAYLHFGQDGRCWHGAPSVRLQKVGVN